MNKKNKDYISVKAPGGWGYSGNVENFKKVGKIGLCIGAGVGLISITFYGLKRGINYFFGEKEKDAALQRKMKEMELKQQHWREKHPQKEAPVAEFGTETSVEDEGADEELEAQPSWLEHFMGRFKMPNLLGILKTVMAICPQGYEPAMLLHLLSMFGALCFSKVRAKYLDGILHAPNLQVIIEGGWGTGKGKFETIYKLLCARIIDADVEKMNCIDSENAIHPVVQTVGLGLTRAKYFEILYATKGLHLYNFSPEIKEVINDLKKQNGLPSEHYCKAFDNSTVYQDNMKKNAKCGHFPVFYNYTFTGTPADIKKFISGELEGGSLSRIVFGVMPDTGKNIPSLGTIAEPELEKIRDQIDEWKSKYCYQTIGGEDIIQPETIIDLDYVSDALQVWLDDQYELSKKEKKYARDDARKRMAAIAFNASMVIAMIYGNPSAKEHAKRKAVVDLTIYIANMCMERFLHKFGDMQNAQHAEAIEAEKVKSGAVETSSNVTDNGITDEVVAEWYRLNNLEGDKKMGYATIAKMYGTSKDIVRSRIKSYKMKLNK